MQSFVNRFFKKSGTPNETEPVLEPFDSNPSLDNVKFALENLLHSQRPTSPTLAEPVPAQEFPICSAPDVENSAEIRSTVSATFAHSDAARCGDR